MRELLHLLTLFLVGIVGLFLVLGNTTLTMQQTLGLVLIALASIGTYQKEDSR